MLPDVPEITQARPLVKYLIVSVQFSHDRAFHKPESPTTLEERPVSPDIGFSSGHTKKSSA
jgi:hypothetical protein